MSMKLTIPGYICHLNPEERTLLDTLMRHFGNARRRAYQLTRKQRPPSEIEKILQNDHALNFRYAKDAFYSIKTLPSHITFGGLKNQRLREKAKITREEYRQRRNSFLLSRGDKSKQGNLNLRLNRETMTLRVTTQDPHMKWIFLPIYIPQKYLTRYDGHLDGTQPYTVTIKRRDCAQGYDLRITIQVPLKISETSRVLTLDVNAGHTAFSVVNKPIGRVVALGTFHHPATQYTKKGKRETLVHKLVDKIGNVARHYQAEVVTGTLNTGKFKGHRRATRVIR